MIPRSKLLNYVRAFSEHFPFSELLHLSTNRFSCNVVSQPRFDSTTSVFYRLIESWYLLESSHFLKLRQLLSPFRDFLCSVFFGYTNFNVSFWYFRRRQTTFTFSRYFFKSFRFPSFPLPPQPLEPFACHLVSSLILHWFLILEPFFPFLYDWRLQDLEGIPTYLLTWFLILTSEANHIIASFVERFWTLLLSSHKLDLQSRTITYSAPSNSLVFPSFPFPLPFFWLWLPAISSAPFRMVDHSNWESPVNDDCIFVDSADHTEVHTFLFWFFDPILDCPWSVSSLSCVRSLSSFCVGLTTQRPDSVPKNNICLSFTGGLSLWKELQSSLQS